MTSSENKLVFIVDDDPVFTKGLEEYLSAEIPGIKTRSFSTGEACLHEMYLNPMVIILDYYLNSEFPYAWNGEEILKKIEGSFPGSKIIIISSQKNVEVAVECLRHGAYEYVTKNEKALPAIKNILLDIIDNGIEY